MIWCDFESDYFDKGQFSKDQGSGLWLHTVDPRHTTSGDLAEGYPDRAGALGVLPDIPLADQDAQAETES